MSENQSEDREEELERPGDEEMAEKWNRGSDLIKNHDKH